MDIEGYAKRALLSGECEGQIEDRLASRIREIKGRNVTEQRSKELAHAVLVEAKATLEPNGDIFKPVTSGITMGQFGVGSRGMGDFYTHEQIARVIGKTSAEVDTSHLDDSGVVRTGNGEYLVVTVDGIHSRLSDYPFLAGFHVARAALRDIYAMGARPLAMLSDIHVADDGDVGKIFDHIAGITTVAELTGVPLITGSTLRIGGDMVIGERMTGGVGAVGITGTVSARILAEPGDVILMTEGAGGGTISTTALYYGKHEIVDETINLKFIEACEAIMDAGLLERIHAMTDVTNGGVRGDAKEISRTAGVELVFREERIRPLVNPLVLSMLEELEIDYLGVSLDALLIIAPEDAADAILSVLGSKGIAADVIGRVGHGSGAKLEIDGRTVDFSPRFRESAYTPIKKLVGEAEPLDFKVMCDRIDEAARKAIDKKQRIIERLK
ncbi:MAG: AIR synthase-related protein [Methanosarcinales archaeon]|nr:AIR synthase-related protein [ANME-2 cluster archaeon]MDW7776152.1 AIR synthase-related protein [Methanosarcinales archaeon]